MISVRLPNWLHKQLRERARREGIFINQLINSAAAEKLAVLLTEQYLEARAKRASRGKFEAALKTVPDVEPELFDRILPKAIRRRSRQAPDRRC